MKRSFVLVCRPEGEGGPYTTIRFFADTMEQALRAFRKRNLFPSPYEITDEGECIDAGAFLES